MPSGRSRSPSNLVNSIVGYGVLVVSFVFITLFHVAIQDATTLHLFLFRLCAPYRHILQISVAFLAILRECVLFHQVAGCQHASVEALRMVCGYYVCRLHMHVFQSRVVNNCYPIHFVNPWLSCVSPTFEFNAAEQMYIDLTWHQRWFAAFSFSCAFEFTFMSCAELLVLHRYLDLALNGLRQTTAENSAVNRRCKACALLVVCFSLLDIMSSSASMHFRLQTPVGSTEWYLSNRRADYATAAQMLSEVCALAIKAALFVFISRLDLQRIAKIELMTTAHLLQVR